VYISFYLKLKYYLILLCTIEYESNHATINPAKIIMKHITWFINTLDKSIKDNNSLMEVSILCLIK